MPNIELNDTASTAIKSVADVGQKSLGTYRDIKCTSIEESNLTERAHITTDGAVANKQIECRIAGINAASDIGTHLIDGAAVVARSYICCEAETEISQIQGNTYNALGKYELFGTMCKERGQNFRATIEHKICATNAKKEIVLAAINNKCSEGFIKEIIQSSLENFI